MAINNEDFYHMIELLNNEDKKTVYDFMQFLNERSNTPESWKKINELNPDDEPLSENESEQIKSEEGFIAGEDAMREYKIRTNLP